MDGINEVTMVDPITERSDGLPDQVIAEIELLEQQPQQFNGASVLGSFRSDSEYLDEMVATYGSEITGLDAELGLHSATNNSSCDSRLPDINVNRLADEIFTLRIQTKQQHEVILDLILDLQKQVKVITDIHQMNQHQHALLGEEQRLHQTHVEQQPMVQQGNSRTLSEIDEDDTVTKLGRSQLNDCSGAMEQLQEMETAQSPKEKCTETSVINTQSINDVGYHDESERPTLSDMIPADQKTVLGKTKLLHQIQVEQEPVVDNATINGQLSDGCNEERVIVTRSKEQSARSHQGSSFVQSEGSLRMKLRSVRNRKGGAVNITPNLRGTEASSKDSRISCKQTKTYTCEECKKRFTCNSYLTQHLRIHSGEKPYKCTECNVAFNHLGNLRRHRRIHSGEKPYQCVTCCFAFSDASSLKKHQRIHSGKKPYRRNDSNPAFSHAGKLKAHQRTQSDGKFYKCKKCNVGFSRASNLKSHQKVHSDETPFICNICKKSFRHEQTLSTHMDTHKDIKSHKCNVCEKEFRSRSNLRRHLKIHSKQKPDYAKR